MSKQETAGSALANRLRRLSAGTHNSSLSTHHSSVDERPGCTFGAVTRQKVNDLAEVTARIESKVNAILGGVALAVLVEIVRSFQP